MKYLTIVMDNTKGKLARASKLLAEADINIEGIDAEEIDDHGVMHIGVASNDIAAAYEVLREAGFQVMPQSVLLVRMEDKPGGLAKVAAQLEAANVNIRSMRIVRRIDGETLCAITPDEIEDAKAVLGDAVVESHNEPV